MWKPISGYNGIYLINKLGKIKSIGRRYCDNRFYKDKILKPRLSSNGYYTITLYKNNKPKVCTIHRLLMLNFVSNPFNHPCVNHINGIRTDNRLRNLEWCTHSYNHKHSFKENGRIIWNKGKIGKQKNHNISGLKSGWNKGKRGKSLIFCNCGTEFYPPKWSSKYCSKSCATKARY